MTSLKSITQLSAEYAQTKKTGCMPTGFPQLDRLIGGFSEGEFIVVGGRPGMGKTQLLVNLSLNLSQTYPVLFLSFELSRRQVFERILAALSDVETCKIAQENLNEEEKSRLAASLKTLDKYRLFIDDCAPKTIESLVPYCIWQIKTYEIKMIVIDFIQLLSLDRTDCNRSEIWLEIKNLAKENNVCIVASSAVDFDRFYIPEEIQLPALHDLNMHNLEEYADRVLFISSSDSDAVVDMVVAKNYHGATKRIRLKRTPEFTRIFDPKTELDLEKDLMMPF